MCNSCSGSGEHRCTNCGGGGIVTCGTCGGSTRVTCSSCQGECKIATVDVGSIDFTSTSDTKGISEIDVPERYITASKGTKFETDENWTAVTELETETTVRRQVERRHVDVTRIDYSYGGEEWSVFDVEGVIRAQSYPQSQARNIIPWIIGLGILLVVGYGIYQYLL